MAYYGERRASGYGYQQQPARPPCEYGGRPACNKFNAGGGCMMSGQQIIPQGQIVRVCSKANPDYALAIRDGRAVMAFYNPNDPTMQWVKDESWSNQVRDQVGHPAFALVNKATGQALRHAIAECQEVLITQYEGPTSYDENILWSESEDMGYGYRTIRMANNIGLNLDAFQGDRRSGGIRDGTGSSPLGNGNGTSRTTSSGNGTSRTTSSGSSPLAINCCIYVII